MRTSRSLILAVCIVSFLPPMAEAQVRLGLTNKFELSPQVQVDEVERSQRAELDRVAALVENENWTDAVVSLRKLIAQGPGKLIALGDHRFVGLREFCHWKIATLPAQALEIYRGQVDPTARRMFDKAHAARDEARLQSIVDEMFCSSVGDDALFALGSYALERGDFASARRHWERISPQLRTGDWAENELVRETRPDLPLWLAFRGVDIEEHWPEIEKLLEPASRSVSRLVYPDTDLSLADVRTRLVLISILEGVHERAQTELALLGRLHPEAKGRIAGRDVVYRDALAKLLAQSSEWPATDNSSEEATFAGSLRRNAVEESEIDLGAMLAGYPVPLEHVARSNPAIAIKHGYRPKRIAEDHERLLSYHPIVVDDTVFVSDSARIKAFDLKTGKPAWGLESPTIYRDDEFAEQGFGAQRSLGVARYTLAADGRRLYARLGSPVTSRPPGRPFRNDASAIVCLDLRYEGRLLWKIPQPPDRAEFEKQRWSFEGPPVSDGRRVYVGMRRSAVRPQAHVACFDAQTGRMIWRQFICAAETPARGQEDECSHNLLTLHGDRLYYNTNAGAVAAINTADGSIDWLYQYQRASSGRLLTPAGHWYRDLNPCIYHRGVVYVGPTDSPHLFAIDAAEGKLLWRTVAPPPEMGRDPVHLLGVADDHLIASGRKLWWINIYSGKFVAQSHDSHKSGPDPYGRGVLVGEKVWWPLRNEILAYRQRPIRSFGGIQSPVARTELGGRGGKTSGGNLLLTGDVLLIAMPDALAAFSQANVRDRSLSKTE